MNSRRFVSSTRWSVVCSPAARPCAVSHPIQPLQLLFNLGTMLTEHFVNPLVQVDECFDVHP
jgi:hypothetical protein